MQSLNILRRILVSLCIGIVVVILLALPVWAQPAFTFNGTFNHLLNAPPNQAFVLTPDQKIAVTVTFLTSTFQGQLTSFDPVTGTVFDSEIVHFQPWDIELVQLSDGIRVGVLSRGGAAAEIYDMSKTGQLTLRFPITIATGSADGTQNLLLSARSRSAFVKAPNTQFANEFVSFSLDNGAVQQRIVLPSSETTYLTEDANRTLIVSGSDQTLNFIDATNPSNLQSLGAVTLPGNGVTTGFSEIKVVFSNDGNIVFAISDRGRLTAINTVTRGIIGSLAGPDIAPLNVKIIENGGQRLLALRATQNLSPFFKGITLVDASNPAKMTVLNQLPLPSDVFSFRDLALTRDGKKLALIGDNNFIVYRIPAFTQLLSFIPNMSLSFTVRTAGQPERFMAAWGSTNNFAATIMSFPNRNNAVANYDVDGKSDLSVYRPSTHSWIIRSSLGGGDATMPFPQSGDIPVSADFDGDGKTDPGAFRPGSGTWFYIQSSTATLQSGQLGVSSDQFIPADYDGDGKDDLAVFRAFNHSWTVLRSSDGQVMSRKVSAGRGKAVRGDYDGDGIADYAYFENTGRWQIFNSGGSAVSAQLGQSGDIPLSGDFDNDGKTDLAVFRPSNNTWIISQSFAGPRSVVFGQSGDKLVPADYDGDGKTDIAIFRPSNSTWSIQRSSDGGTVNTVFGQAEDIPAAWQR